MMKSFNLYNNVVGWALFAFAFTVYAITVEETASFWDCGEFIAVSYKLMVPHPPGAPLFLLMGRMFSFLAGPDALLANPSTDVAYYINLLSVTTSALTILFLHWSIVLLGRKMMTPMPDGSLLPSQQLTLLGAGIVGALAYTFSDSFWFSAVEAEVYAMSSVFTAVVFWVILKWDLIEDPAKANKWLVLVAYIIGLSIGVHLLNLVTIPALALVVYYRNYEKPTVLGMLAAMGIGVLIIGMINNIVIPGLPSWAGRTEIFFKNGLGLPFGTGVIFFILLLLGATVTMVIYTQHKGYVILNTAMLGFSYILIGYSTYAMVVIRSNFDTPIDENNPEDIVEFVSYLKREQYGSRPLLSGPTFVAPRVGYEQGAPVYAKKDDRYEIVDYKTEPIYDRDYQMLLPRIYSESEQHKKLYMQWLGMTHLDGSPPGSKGAITKDNIRPLTMGDNLRYMFTYQFGHMYFRYFGWNFIGREGDEKESGILSPFEAEAGPNVPFDWESNKARNNFFAIPFLLGVLGLIYQTYRDSKNAFMLIVFFFLTGLGLVVYLNSPPVEPRERDYIYVGSFYVFAIWIGFSVIAMAETIQRAINSAMIAPILATVLALSAPALMGFKGWDNHDRSNRWHSIDQARNTLASCEKNAILFTGGDNDTFPLWYVQEVEGFRTDVRVIVLSYFSTDWYNEQMRRKVYESDPVPFTMPLSEYRFSKNDYIPLAPDVGGNADRIVNAKVFMEILGNPKHPSYEQVTIKLQDGSITGKLPGKKFSLDLDSAKLASMNILPAGLEKRIPDRMVWELKGGNRHIFKNDLGILDIISANDWQRPIYFNNTSASSTAFDFSRFLYLEGMAYRLLPVPSRTGDNYAGMVGTVHVDKMLENIKKWSFRGFDDPNTYNDDEYRKFGINTRNSYWRLAVALAEQGREEEAVEILDEGITNIPDTTINYGYFMPYYAELYFRLGEVEKGKQITDVLKQRAKEYIRYADANPDKISSNMVDQQQFLPKNRSNIMMLFQIFRQFSQESRSKIAQMEANQELSGEDLSGAIASEKELLDFFDQEIKDIEAFIRSSNSLSPYAR